MQNAKDLINWGELSRQLSNGDRFAIRKDKIPNKYEEKVSELIEAVDKVMNQTKK